MRPRYIVRPYRKRKKAHSFDDDEVFTPDLTVYESEEPYEEIGILNHRGEMLYRDHRLYPIGFHQNPVSDEEEYG